jgi:hypothetical protein
MNSDREQQLEQADTSELSPEKKHRGIDIDGQQVVSEVSEVLGGKSQLSIEGYVYEIESDPSLLNADDVGDSPCSSDQEDEVCSLASSQDSEQLNTDSNEMIKEFVEDAVLRLLDMKEKLCCSEKHFEDLLKWGKSLHVSGNPNAGEHWPNSWNDVQILLKDIGFVSPKLYWICLRPDHPNHYGLMESQDEFCPHCGQTGNIPYYYMSLIEKVKLWCACPDMCKKMSAHWEEKDHWLPEEMKEGWGWHLKKELWDGTRFADLSYFWNPNATWILPVRCQFEGCINILSAKQIMESPVKDDGITRNMTCQDCGSHFDHFPIEVRGDPRNLAYCGKIF